MVHGPVGRALESVSTDELCAYHCLVSSPDTLYAAADGLHHPYANSGQGVLLYKFLSSAYTILGRNVIAEILYNFITDARMSISE